MLSLPPSHLNVDVIFQNPLTSTEKDLPVIPSWVFSNPQGRVVVSARSRHHETERAGRVEELQVGERAKHPCVIVNLQSVAESGFVLFLLLFLRLAGKGIGITFKEI